MPDIYPDFPYKWVSWDDWLGQSGHHGLEAAGRHFGEQRGRVGIWNEPDWTWDTAKAGDFNAGWTRTVQRMRTRDTLAPVAGPGYAGWDATPDAGVPDEREEHEHRAGPRGLARAEPQQRGDRGRRRGVPIAGVVARHQPAADLHQRIRVDRRGRRARPGCELRLEAGTRRGGGRRPGVLVRVRDRERPGRQQQPADRDVVAVQVVRRHGGLDGEHHAARADRPGRVRLLRHHAQARRRRVR